MIYFELVFSWYYRNVHTSSSSHRCSTEETCLHDFFEVLKRILQNFRKTSKKYLLSESIRQWGDEIEQHMALYTIDSISHEQKFSDNVVWRFRIDSAILRYDMSLVVPAFPIHLDHYAGRLWFHLDITNSLITVVLRIEERVYLT